MVLLYQIGPIISNNVISYKKKSWLKASFFMCICH